tara:strand:+ start:381 stop:962 length:582 start_codon:yes stop_codon:yes gene_type:complete
MMKDLPFICSIVIIGGFLSCSSPSIPRPEGYFRIELPKTDFKKSDGLCGYEFEIPLYSIVEDVKSSQKDVCWYNVRFPTFNARLHCTDMMLDNNLDVLIQEAQDLVFSHDHKANGIRRIRVVNEQTKGGARGVLYHLEGPVATPIQFFVTDSTKHFLRGSLYFDNKPNPDSTAPVIDRLLSDVEHFMRTVSWE